MFIYWFIDIDLFVLSPQGAEASLKHLCTIYIYIYIYTYIHIVHCVFIYMFVYVYIDLCIYVFVFCRLKGPPNLSASELVGFGLSAGAVFHFWRTQDVHFYPPNYQRQPSLTLLRGRKSTFLRGAVEVDVSSLTFQAKIISSRSWRFFPSVPVEVDVPAIIYIYISIYLSISIYIYIYIYPSIYLSISLSLSLYIYIYIYIYISLTFQAPRPSGASPRREGPTPWRGQDAVFLRLLLLFIIIIIGSSSSIVAVL